MLGETLRVAGVVTRLQMLGHAAHQQLPFFKRVVIQTVPEPATRANLIERGDADISIDLAASDVIAAA